MIKKWDIAPAPGEKNSARHKLLIKGDMRDVFLVVKKLGAICSRPEKTSGDFDFVIYLSKLKPDTVGKIKELASELSAPSDTTPPMEPAKAAAANPEPFEPPRPKIKTDFDEPITPAAKVSAPESPAAEIAPQPGPAPRAKEPEAAPPSFVTGRGLPFVPAASSRIKAEIEKPEEKPKAAIQPQETPKPAVSSHGKTRWSVELPLVPTCSFKTLISGSHNRFAHAAAMAVVENPGMIYNPLLIFGVPGTGKTHFVHAISYGLSSSIGQDKIFVTNGIKLSKSVDIAVKDGTIGKLDEIMSNVKVLIIDDIHLLMLTDVNRKYISKWLNEFMTKNKQILVTSVFPPKSLGGLEEAVGFQFTQGWMVDLKSPDPQTYKVILAQLLQGMDIKLSDTDIGNIFVDKGTPFGEAIRALEGMKKLEKFIINTEPASHAKLLDILLGLSEMEIGATLTDAECDKASGWKPLSDNSWFKWGIVYPKGMKREAQYALYRTHERSAELGLRVEWQQVFMEEYSPDELYGTPFKIGNLASEHKVNGVIILGPQPTSALGAQEAEFRHITIKILESFMLKGAWIQHGRIKSPAAYTKTLMDLL
ncbi:MAG: DnaA/Hda family protein [Elusimicrobiota bacterium]